MLIDTLTIIVCVALPMLTALAIAANPLWLRPKSAQATPANDEARPRLSVVMSVHDNAHELERNLPALLSQDYAAGYEVIVVDESSTDDTEDVLKRLKHSHPNLYTTFIPRSSHYLSRRKLGLTVGVKAAKGEWIVFTDADCKPRGDQWLAALASHCTEGKDLVLGYTSYADGTSAFRRFYQLLEQWRALRSARRTAYRYGGHALAMRRSLFVEGDGFREDLKYLRGEYDFLVNEYAAPHNTAIATEPEARLVQDEPSHTTWLNDHLFYMETRRHLNRSLSFRLPVIAGGTLLHLSYILQVATIAASATFGRWLELGVAAFCLAMLYTLRAVAACRAFKPMGERLPWWLIPLMELRMAWSWTGFFIRHARADKYDFIRK